MEGLDPFGSRRIEGVRFAAIAAADGDYSVAVAARRALPARRAAVVADEQRDKQQRNERNCAQVHAPIFSHGRQVRHRL